MWKGKVGQATRLPQAVPVSRSSSLSTLRRSTTFGENFPWQSSRGDQCPSTRAPCRSALPRHIAFCREQFIKSAQGAGELVYVDNNGKPRDWRNSKRTEKKGGQTTSQVKRLKVFRKCLEKTVRCCLFSFFLSPFCFIRVFPQSGGFTTVINSGSSLTLAQESSFDF